MFRTLSVLSGLAAVGMLGWAGYLALHPPPEPTGGPIILTGPPGEATGLVVADAEQDLGPVPVGEHTVHFHVANRSDRPGAVVGCTSGCNAVCCLEAEERGRVPVPPGQTAGLSSTLSVRRPGPFAFDGELYLDDGGRLRAVRLKVSGVGVAPTGEKAHAPPP